MTAAPVFDQKFRDQLDSLFLWRRDVRHFRRDPVPENVLDHMLALTCVTPSVGLSQPGGSSGSTPPHAVPQSKPNSPNGMPRLWQHKARVTALPMPASNWQASTKPLIISPSSATLILHRGADLGA